MPTATYRGTRPELHALLARLPAILAGKVPDPHQIALGFQLRIGIAALSRIQTDFLTKSGGGTGTDGIKWEPLKRETIAQRRTTKAELKGFGITGKRVRGLLTPAEDKLWRQIYARNLARLRLHIGEGPARSKAAAIAWAELKRRGAKTKLDVLGGRIVDIGRDTGRMLRAFTPGVDDVPSGEPEQVFEMPTGAVIIGNNVPYFPRFHEKRPCWPVDGSVPSAWWGPIRLAAERGMIRAVELMLQGAN